MRLWECVIGPPGSRPGTAGLSLREVGESLGRLSGSPWGEGILHKMSGLTLLIYNVHPLRASAFSLHFVETHKVLKAKMYTGTCVSMISRSHRK